VEREPRRGRRPLLALVLAIAAIGLLGAALAWLLDDPKAPPGSSPEARLYYAYCVTCHGADGRGAWRATLSLLRPGDLGDSARMAQHTDRYLFDLIKHGGAPVGRPGMPAFGHVLDDARIEALVRFLRTLARSGRPPR
jgi:mono/diheme cytochrome c family protein